MKTFRKGENIFKPSNEIQYNKKFKKIKNTNEPSNQQGLISKTYKELLQLSIKTKQNKMKTNNNKKSNKKREDLNRYFFKNMQMVKKHMKICSVLLIIVEKQIKISMRFYLTPVRMAIIKITCKHKCWRGYGGKRTLTFY